MSVSLIYEQLEPRLFTGACRHTWPLRVTAASDEAGLPDEIFVWHSDASDYQDGDVNPFRGDRCECVASVHQLSSVPIVDDPEDPSGQLRIPFYRADKAVFHCLSEAQALELKAKIEADVQDLLQNFRAFNIMAAGGTVTVD